MWVVAHMVVFTCGCSTVTDDDSTSSAMFATEINPIVTEEFNLQITWIVMMTLIAKRGDELCIRSVESNLTSVPSAKRWLIFILYKLQIVVDILYVLQAIKYYCFSSPPPHFDWIPPPQFYCFSSTIAISNTIQSSPFLQAQFIHVQNVWIYLHLTQVKI